jgi:hypothetical protein
MSVTRFDYERIDSKQNNVEDEPDSDSFKIVSGKYSGTIVRYGSVSITEPLDGDTDAKLNFNFIIDHSNIDKDELNDSKEFNTYMGDMLVNIIQTSIEEMKETDVTNDNTEKSDNQ